MRWALALLVLCAVGGLGVAAYVVLDNRDPVPGEVAACVKKKELTLARSTGALSVMRQDVLDGTAKVAQRFDWGRTDGVLVRGRGPAGPYAVLALWNSDTPTLAGDGAARTIYEKPGQLPLVSAEAPERGVLADCARAQ